jgi:acyl-homoserine-lactone acylase
MTAAFDRRGRPRGEALLSYSQSAHYADQTRRYSRKQWVPMRFTERSIRRDRAYRRTVVTGRR